MNNIIKNKVNFDFTLKKNLSWDYLIGTVRFVWGAQNVQSKIIIKLLKMKQQKFWKNDATSMILMTMYFSSESQGLLIA